MNSDDKALNSSQVKNQQSQSKNKNNRELIANSSLIKSYQTKNKNQKPKEESVILPELPGAAKGKLALERDLVKKLPSTSNVTTTFEGADKKYMNLARKTEAIKMMDPKSPLLKMKVNDTNKDQDVSMYSGEDQSFEELKEDQNSSQEGETQAPKQKDQSELAQNNGNKRKLSSSNVTQAQKKLLIPDSSVSCIKESMREYLSSEAYSPDDHHIGSINTGTVKQATLSGKAKGGQAPKLPAFVLNIKETQEENSSNPSEELTSQQTGKITSTIDQDAIEAEIQQKLREEILSIVGGPEPLYQLSHKYAEGSDSPMWKRKQMRNRIVPVEPMVDINVPESLSGSLSDGEEGSDLPGDQQSEMSESNQFRLKDGKQKKKKTKKNKAIQEKLERQGERIPIQTAKAIDTSKHSDLFGYMIYDGYRPTNLAQTRDYLEFMTRSPENLGDDVLTQTEAPSHILEYLERDLDTKLPKDIDQRSILRFDQNFEGGNLDSAYIINPYQYNMLLKVDSNTRGNTYWFFFSVQDFKVGQRYTFNIQNFTRSMDKFYKDGMNVLTKSESLGPEDVDAMAEKMAGTCTQIKEEANENPDNESSKVGDKNTEDLLQVQSEQQKKEQSKPSTSRSRNPAPEDRFKEWKYGQCENIHFEASDIPRTKNMINMAKYQMSVKDKEKYFYSMLSFSYRFKQEDAGKKVYFAYALPYSYSDLLHDLENAKNTLITHMSPLYSNLAKKAGEDEQPDDPIGNLGENETPCYRIIDKADMFDLAKIKNLSNFNNDQQYKTGQEVESPQDARRGEASHVSTKQTGPGSSGNLEQRQRSINPKKLQFQQKQSQSSKSNAQFEFMHDQIKKQATESMQLKTSKFENDFIKRDEKGTNQLKELILNEAAASPLSNQHNFEITNDYLQWRQEVIAQTMGGLNVFQITLTKRRKAGSIPHKKKQVIYIQARLHAAETHGSFIMSSLIKEFSQNYIKYDQILKDNIVKLVPMVNPDGVVLGNSRSSLAGVDLNRRWSNPNSTLHPELYFLKMSMRETKNDSRGISIFCDLHGHNKNSNCFIYGCNKAPNEGLLSWTKTRLLPKIFASYEPICDFNMCKFSQEKTKYNTARVVIWNEFKVTNSFTLETSQYGQKLQQGTKFKRGNCIQLFVEDLNNIGINLLQSINKFVVIEAKLQKDLKKNGGWFKKKILDQITGQSARSKLDSQNNKSNFSHLRKYSESSRQVQGAAFAAAAKKAMGPGRHNTQDNLLNKVAVKNKESSSRNLLNQGVTPNASKVENSSQRKRGSMRMGSEEDSLSASDNGKGEKIKHEIQSPVPKAKEMAHSDPKQIENSGKLKDKSSFRIAKTESSPLKGLDQGQSLSSKSPGAKAPSSKRTVNETTKKPQLNKRGVPLPEQSRKKVKESEPELPDCLAEFFSKNEFNSAVLESRLPTDTKEADNASKQDEAESDSEPSCDNFEVTEMKKIFSNAISEEDLDEVFADDLEPEETTKVPETKTETNDLNTVIEQIAEHDEVLGQQSADMSYEEPKPSRELIQLPGSKSPSVQVHSQNEIDTERLREQIKSIQDYKQIAKQLKSAQMESKKLADKFDSLSRQLNNKIKDDTKSFSGQQQLQAALVSPQLFGNASSWEQVRDGNSQNQYAAHARTSSLQPMQEFNTDLNKIRKQILPAGPISGESKSGERIRPRGASTNVIMHLENSSNLPAISQNSLNQGNMMQRKKKTMATTQAKASKYKSRNNVLSMSAYNMENGLATLTKNANILGTIKAQQAQTHVHPQYAVTSQIMPKNQAPQGLNGILVGQQVQGSPNQTSANKVKRKRKANLNDQGQNNNQTIQNQHPSSPNPKQQPNMSHPLKSEQMQRGQMSSGGQDESIRTNGSMPLNGSSFNTHQSPTLVQPPQRTRPINKNISMPISNMPSVSGDYSAAGTILYASESQGFAPSSIDINHQIQQQIQSNQLAIAQSDQIRKDVQTSPVQKAGFYLNSSLEWVQCQDDSQSSPVPFPNQLSSEKRGNMSDNTHLRLQDLNQMNRQRKLSPASILYNQTPSSGNKLRKEVINARQHLEEAFQNPFGIAQQSLSTPQRGNKALKNDYQEDYNQMQQNDNIHNVLHVLPNTVAKNTRIGTTDVAQNMIQFKQDPNKKARNSVQFNNLDWGQREGSKGKSQATNRNFFQSDNVKQYLQNQQIILKPHQIRKGAADQIIQEDQINNEIIKKQRRYANTKFNGNVEPNAYDPAANFPRELNTAMQNVPERVSIPILTDKDQFVNNQNGLSLSYNNMNRNMEMSPQNVKRKMIKTKTQQVVQAQNSQSDGRSFQHEQSIGTKQELQALQSNNKSKQSIVNFNQNGQVVQKKQDQQMPKTQVMSPVNNKRMNRLSYIQSNQVQFTGSPQNNPRINELPPMNTLNNNHESTQFEKQQADQYSIYENSIEDKSRGSHSNYQVIHKNTELINTQGKSKRYATNLNNLPINSPNKQNRNYGPLPTDNQFGFGMQTFALVNKSSEKIEKIVLSPRSPFSQTPGSNFKNKMIRKSIPLQQTKNQNKIQMQPVCAQNQEFQDLHDPQRIHTETEQQNYQNYFNLMPVQIKDATATGTITNRKTVAQFDENIQTPSVIDRRHVQNMQHSTPQGRIEKIMEEDESKKHLKVAQIKMSKKQVQNIIKQQINK